MVGIYFLFIVLNNLTSSSLAKTRVYNVLNFGAIPTGLIDTRKAFIGAWEAACSAEGKTHIVVPKGRYLLNPINFSGVGCKSNDITFMVDGTVIAPNDYRVLGAVERWVWFDRVDGVTIYGRGTLDAKGSSLWDCKKGKDGDKCPPGATTLTFTNANNILIKGITSLNCQLFHMVINICKNVTFEAIKIIAPSDSPNTDGIHVQVASDVTIKNTIVKTGDDCVSVGPGTKNLWVERIVCGPSHGI
ncbi:Polygalacturonase, partial [Bienertia sinuspersici]